MDNNVQLDLPLSLVCKLSRCVFLMPSVERLHLPASKALRTIPESRIPDVSRVTVKIKYVAFLHFYLAIVIIRKNPPSPK